MNADTVLTPEDLGQLIRQTTYIAPPKMITALFLGVKLY